MSSNCGGYSWEWKQQQQQEQQQRQQQYPSLDPYPTYRSLYPPQRYSSLLSEEQIGL